MIRIRKSLSSKLTIGIFLVTLSIFVISLGGLFLQSRRIVRQEAMERTASVLNTTTLRVSAFLSIIETATNSFDWLAVENLYPDSLLAYSQRLVLLNKNVNGCSITTEPYLFPQYGRYFSAYSIREKWAEEGFMRDSVTTVREGEYEYFEKVWYKTPHTLGKPCWTDPFDDYNEGTLYSKELIASFCKPLYKHGKFVGVISTDLALRQLSDTVNAEHPTPNAYFMMIGKDGHYFIHPDTAMLFKESILDNKDSGNRADFNALGQKMMAGKTGSLRMTIKDESCLVCYQPVPGTPWSLALVCPETDILKSYYRLVYIIVPILIIGMVIILLLSWRVVSHAVKPLNSLVSQSKRITSGQYDVHIPYSSREDAIGQLQNSFATMLQRLNFHMGSIRYTVEQTSLRNKELEHATLLAEEAGKRKTTFIQNVSHQIRTPLNIILGFAQVLRDNDGKLPEDERKNIAEMMVHNTQTLSRMVMMLFDSSDTGLAEELKSRKSELVPCNEVARESIHYTNIHFPNLSIKFETTLLDGFCIRSNRLYLMRSLRELLYNAAKYSDGENISLSLKDTDSSVQFIFEDTGSGISEDYYEQMYEAFTKVNDLSEGLGLGLPLAKRHAKNLGGDLILDKDYHLGCRFILELPK